MNWNNNKITNFFTQFMHKNNSQLAADPKGKQAGGALWIVALKCRSGKTKKKKKV